ncbi:AAA-domain-containing protein [Saccharata proteae CBS 121410]|uniref:AAA-domain-containing protein n=1 Tax=Saccharata proteae CBS 121410 TaxID=1314787 RepID=A0A9P4HUY9_9PEZI|nr:AAA-domain-containing protein [Saccharata proteae CBS 121410]
MRQKPSAAMQKTYDDCYLVCSTAVYFETQGNEAEALRSWRNALDQIYYFNAYRRPATYVPRSETEKALQASLRQLELQCKERVDILEALRQSREDAKAEKEGHPDGDAATIPRLSPQGTPKIQGELERAGWLGHGTIPAMSYPDISRPPLPKRPSFPKTSNNSSDTLRANSFAGSSSGPRLSPPIPPSSAPPTKKSSRTPSPEKRGGMLKTLRPTNKDGRKSSSTKVPTTLRSRPPAAAKAATQAWGSTSGSRNKVPMFAVNNASRETIAAQSAPASREVSKSYSHEEAPKFDSTGLIRPSSPRNGKNEYPVAPTNAKKLMSVAAPKPMEPKIMLDSSSPASKHAPQCVKQGQGIRRKAVAAASSSQKNAPIAISTSAEDDTSSSMEREVRARRRQGKSKAVSTRADLPPTPTSAISGNSDAEDEESPEDAEWKERVDRLMKHLPKGVDEAAAKQIFNEIVIHGDEVRWGDVAGLEVAKGALKETVVYPFLRPDLFMGLREPARGMLLFGPPGTGKTMLARAVATESKSTFFAISASSLTSKYLGESEKLVRALFQLAKALAPSIIFVDEIDSLLSSRSGSSEHEATRRIKTEFLIQWSDLAKAAAGREQSEKEKEKGDASRVLVLAATNLPWAIDEAARRRFVRRQYIPLPEDQVRKLQLQTLLSHQKHSLSERDLDRLVVLTEGFSGSDITALAKDAAMGPLRSLGEKLLHMTMDEIRPIQMEDFRASLINIRPSVSKQGLKEFEDWAKEFGERGG